jgi:hypothetical protein
VRRDQLSIAASVLDDEDQAHGPRVLRLKRFSLEGRSSVGCLEVWKSALDLEVTDLGWCEEHEVCGSSKRIADGQLQRRTEGLMGLADKELSHAHLPAVA